MQKHILYHTQKELYTVTVTPKNAHLIHWQHQREFSYHGVLFDVVEKEVLSPHKIVYHCIADYKETALFADLDHFIKKDHPHKGHFKIPKVHFFQGFLPEKQLDVVAVMAQWDEKTRRQWLYQLNYLAPVLSINSPPPEAEA